MSRTTPDRRHKLVIASGKFHVGILQFVHVLVQVVEPALQGSRLGLGQSMARDESVCVKKSKWALHAGSDDVIRSLGTRS